MSSTNSIQWTNSDFNRILEGVASQNFSDSKSTYPWLILKWNSQESIPLGSGVMQFKDGYYDPTQWENNVVVSTANYFNWEAWENIIQLALAQGVIGPLLNDGLFSNGNINESVTLEDYVQDMLRPQAATDASTTPWPINQGNFNADRLCCRNYLLNTSVPLQLPYQQSLFQNNYMAVYPVIPPRGYVCVGHYVLAQQDNLSGQRVSPAGLLFCAKDARFVQPPVGTTPWPFPDARGVPTYYNQRVGSTFTRTVNQLNTEETEFTSASYVFSTLGNLLVNKVTPFPTDPNFSSYPNHFPWAVNLQLVRFFPNGPDGSSTRFQSLNINRLISQGVNHGSTGNNQTTPSAKIVNPNLSTTFYYPVENGYSGTSNLSFSPVNQAGQATWPIVIPFSVVDMLNCCTGQYSNPSVVWTWQDFKPYPVNVTSSITLQSQAICQAGGFSYLYIPGTDCNLLSTAYCNDKSTRYATSPNCACFNVAKMLASAGLVPYPAPPNDVGLAQTQAIFTSNIACLYTNCANVASALKTTGMTPINGQKCPNIQNCVISGNTVTGDSAQLINSCTQGGTAPTTEPSGSLNSTVQVFLIVAAVLFLVIGAIILLLRKRKKRKSDKEADKAQSEYDLYDDDEDAPSEYRDAFRDH